MSCFLIQLDPSLLELTASEPLTLQEEYEMQQSWRDDPKKCTFIVLSGQSGGNEIDAMIGDVNVFLNDPDDDHRVELDVMIAEPNYRGKGCGKEAVLLMMWYCTKFLRILNFYCKIHERNESSLRLFQSLGFTVLKFVGAFQEFELIYNFPSETSFHEYFLEKFGRSAESIESCSYDENDSDWNENHCSFEQK